MKLFTKKTRVTLTMIVAVILGSCSGDSVEETLEITQDTRQVLSDQKTNIGTYKGVFTTNDAEYRGVIEIEITNISLNPMVKSFHRATITTQTGDIIFAKSFDTVIKGQAINEIEFISNDISFTFSVNADGSNSEINNVVYKNKTSNILVAKHTNKAPISPLTGTFTVTYTENGTYPMTGPQTFNLMFTNAGGPQSGVDVQTTYNGVTHIANNGVQQSCTNGTVYSLCDIQGTFTIGQAPVPFNGTHKYSSDGTTADCSTAIGEWQIQTVTWGLIKGEFKTDTAPCGEKDLRIIRFNDFRGTGFVPTPTNGEINSNYMLANGLSDGNGTFGGTHNSGDFARGVKDAGTSTGGVYAFKVAPGNYTLGIQPAGSDFTPGYFEMRVPNTQPNPSDLYEFSYSLWVYNDQDRSTRVKAYYSIDNGTTYTNIPSLDFATNAPKEVGSNLVWEKHDFSGSFNAVVASGQNLLIKFEYTDNGGSGSRDQIGLDDIVIYQQY